MNMHMRKLPILALGTVLALAGCAAPDADGAEAQAPAAEGASASPTRVINVEVREVGTETFQERVRLTGIVEANRDVTISAEESGPIVEILARKGATVRAGAPLLRIDGGILRAQVEQAEAQAELAAESWERRRRLWEEDRVGSELAFLEAQSNARQTEAALEALRRRLERTVIRAPIDGVVDDRMVELGTLVSPGTPVARVVDVTPLKIVAGVPERYALDVREGAAGIVTLDVFPGETFEGTVEFVGTTVDAQSRTFPVELTLRGQHGAVKPEMVANVAVDRNAIENAIVVPQNAVVRKEEGYVVFVVDGETARARPVVLGPSQENRVVILEGLSPGERVVVTGQQMVADGDRIRIVGEG